MKRVVFWTFLIFFGFTQLVLSHIPDIQDVQKSILIQKDKESDIFLAENYYRKNQYQNAIKAYLNVLSKSENQKPFILKKLALCYAGLGNSKKAETYVKKYFIEEFDASFLKHEGFDGIRTTPEFKKLVTTFTTRFSAWGLLFIYIALIGFFVALILNLNRKIDVLARIFISTLVGTHSLFILHLCIFGANYHYVFPHFLYLSSGFALLSGPLLYLYLKRVTVKSKFPKIDLLHLLPTVLLIGYLMPSYILTSKTKLALLIYGEIDTVKIISNSTIIILVSAKLISLIVYGFLIQKLNFEVKTNPNLNLESKNWLQLIFRIHLAFIVVYIIYAVLTINGHTYGFLYHLQLFCMSVMVLFIGYSAYVQPDLFNGVRFKGNRMFKKYESSVLTKSYSSELKEQIIILFEKEKIYRKNDLNLVLLASKLNTTRHSTSQIINEHFDMNFNELVNKYRIEEAKEILLLDEKNELNIIDIVYSVGFNNKVSFSRAFKKHTNTTPSQYRVFLQNNFTS